MIAGKGRRPVVEQRYQPAGRHVLSHHVLEQERQAKAVERRAQDLADIVEDQLSLDPHADLLAILFKLPGIEPAIGRKPCGDAVILRELPRRQRSDAAGHVVGGTDHDQARIRRDAHRHHVLVHLFAEAHAGIEAFRHDIGQRQIGKQLHSDVGIALQQRPELWPEHGVDRMLGGGDAKTAGRPLAKLPQRLQLLRDAAEGRTESRQQPFAGLRRGEAAGRAREKPHPEPFLEPPHDEAQRRLRCAKPGGGAGEAALLRHALEGHQVAEILPPHSLISDISSILLPGLIEINLLRYSRPVTR